MARPFHVPNSSAPHDEDLDAALTRLDGLARVLDSAVRIPGTDVRLGVDALIGIIPVAGDLVGKLVSAYLIYEARRLGASRWVIARMSANTTLDTVVGAIPVLGDVFDLMYRANEKNVRLLREHLAARGARSSKHRAKVIDQYGRVLDSV